jgi:hypothetical protein
MPKETKATAPLPGLTCIPEQVWAQQLDCIVGRTREDQLEACVEEAVRACRTAGKLEQPTKQYVRWPHSLDFFNRPTHLTSSVQVSVTKHNHFM